MKKIKILVYGKNPEILPVVVRLINSKEAWEGEGTMEEEEVIDKGQTKAYDLILIGGGVSEMSEKKVRVTLGKLVPNLKIIQHFGGGSGLLFSEIEGALSGNEEANFSIIRVRQKGYSKKI